MRDTLLGQYNAFLNGSLQVPENFRLHEGSLPIQGSICKAQGKGGNLPSPQNPSYATTTASPSTSPLIADPGKKVPQQPKVPLPQKPATDERLFIRLS